MFDNFDVALFLIGLGDIRIWCGIYFLYAKAHIRNAEKNGSEPELKKLRIVFVTAFLITHIFYVWIGFEVVKWGGPD
jgi:hypothetical protein